MKINQITKKDGSTVYRTSVYLGIDSMTGKKIKTSVTGRTKKELKKKVKEAENEFVKNGSTRFNVHNDIKTVKELAKIWLENYRHTVKPQTFRNTQILINSWILPKLGKLPLTKITPPLVQSYINDLAKTFRQFDKVRSVLSRLFQYAVVLQLVTYNPVRDTLTPKKQKSDKEKVKYIQPEHLKIFLDHIDQVGKKNLVKFTQRVIFRLLLATGVRIGELSALEWSDIDFKSHSIRINKSYVAELKIVGETKTTAGERIISIDNDTVLMLKQYKNRQRIAFLEFGSSPSVVFSTPISPYIERGNVQRILDRCCAHLNIPRFTLHAFRHTHASLLLNAGISYKELQYRLGHANISMTLDTYSHLSKEKEQNAVTYYEKAINKL